MEIQPDALILDKLAYNLPISNITNNLSDTRCNTIDGINSTSIAISEQTLCTVNLFKK